MNATDPGLVLLSCGTPDQIQALNAEEAPTLAQTLGLQLDQDGGLVALDIDPGQQLAEGGHWAERLGSRRQCSLLLIPAALHNSGAAAGTTALLRQWRVPLLGLVQWGAPWDPAARRTDGLPWLGWLGPGGGSEGRVALALACGLRWRQLRETDATTAAAPQQPPAA